MNKEQQIEEIEQFIYDYVDSKQTEKVYLCSSHVNELAKPFVHNKVIAEALYNAGYRKTFTSDLASDTQKAFKEGYEKGCETCVQAWDNGYNDGYGSGKEDGVREFAEKVKEKYSLYDDRHILYRIIDELLKEYEE